MILRRSRRPDPRHVLGSALAFMLPFSAELASSPGAFAQTPATQVPTTQVPSPPANNAGSTKGAQPAAPGGSFDSRWGGFQ